MSRRSSLLAALLGPALLAGCADYLNHYDTVTLAAGDAQKQNMLLHTDEPFNPNSHDTAIPTDGQRAADAVTKYRLSQQQPAARLGHQQAVLDGGGKGRHQLGRAEAEGPSLRAHVEHRRQPAPPQAQEMTRAPTTTVVPPSIPLLLPRQAIAIAARHKTNASRLNEFLKPAVGIKTKPVNITPATAPRVFHVSNRPTRPPNPSAPPANRSAKGSTAPIKAAGTPRIIIEKIPAMI